MPLARSTYTLPERERSNVCAFMVLCNALKQGCSFFCECQLRWRLQLLSTLECVEVERPRVFRNEPPGWR